MLFEPVLEVALVYSEHVTDLHRRYLTPFEHVVYRGATKTQCLHYPTYTPLNPKDKEKDKERAQQIEPLLDILDIMDACADTANYEILQIRSMSL